MTTEENQKKFVYRIWCDFSYDPNAPYPEQSGYAQDGEDTDNYNDTRLEFATQKEAENCLLKYHYCHPDGSWRSKETYVLKPGELREPYLWIKRVEKKVHRE